MQGKGEFGLTQVQDITSPMTAMEKRATVSLASIYALRMLGLFMLLPVLSLFTEQMPGSTPKLVGLTMGIYGLTQAILQIPFGLLSDRFSRKTVIVIGLILFVVGSVWAALATDIYGVLIGRALQGCGAISAAVMALLADLTQEVHRTKAMATIGASIGVSFGVAITLGPIIADHFGIAGIFWMIAVLAALAILVILFVVPNPEKNYHPPRCRVHSFGAGFGHQECRSVALELRYFCAAFDPDGQFRSGTAIDARRRLAGRQSLAGISAGVGDIDGDDYPLRDHCREKNGR